MKTIKIWIAMLCFSILMAGGFQNRLALADTMDLISTLVNTLGITEKQAEGGTGALLKNAKENLSQKDFDKVSDAVPKVNDYIAQAPSTDSGNAAGGLLSSGLSSLGGSAGKIGGMAGLADSFSKLGMNTETMTQFIPVVLKFMDSEAGSSVAGLLRGLWQ